MYLIALCDDEEADLDKAESMLKNYQNQHPKQELVIERFRVLRNCFIWLGKKALCQI